MKYKIKKCKKQALILIISRIIKSTIIGKSSHKNPFCIPVFYVEIPKFISIKRCAFFTIRAGFGNSKFINNFSVNITGYLVLFK